MEGPAFMKGGEERITREVSDLLMRGTCEGHLVRRGGGFVKIGTEGKPVHEKAAGQKRFR